MRRQVIDYAVDYPETKETFCDHSHKSQTYIDVDTDIYLIPNLQLLELAASVGVNL